MRFYWKSRRLQTHREILFLLIWSFKQEYQILWRWLSDLRPRESSGSSFPTPWLSSARGLRLAGRADQPGRDQAGQSQEGRERRRHGVGARRLHLSQRGGEEQDWDQPLPHSFSAWTPTELSHTEKWSAVTMISVPLNLNWCENLFSEQNFRDWVVSSLSPSWRTSTSRWSISQTRPGSRSWTTTSDALMRLVEAPVETTPVLEVCLVYIQTDLPA